MGETPPIVDGVVIGQVLLEKYRVESIIGWGGMGVIVECTHIALDERVAIKMLRRDVLDDPGVSERFAREARAAVKLKSEYVARVTDVGAFEDGTPYMVMEYLEGQDLAQLLEQRRHLAVPWAAELMLQTAEALGEAHSLDIVHRDIKPNNLFVTWRPDGSAMIKVLDFGISKAAPIGDESRLTNTQSLLGTPAYMSPEQMRSARQVDARTDIWALGVVMYEIIEGRRPFEAESFTELCVNVSLEPPRPMRKAPPEVQRVILRCLEKSPEQRYASMAEVARDLLPFVTNQNQAAIIVERLERVLRRRASEPVIPQVVTPSPPVVGDVTPRSLDLQTADTNRGPRWPEVTPTTEPDVDVDHLLAERMRDAEVARGAPTPTTPSLIELTPSGPRPRTPTPTEPMEPIVAPPPPAPSTPTPTVLTAPAAASRAATPPSGVPSAPKIPLPPVVIQPVVRRMKSGSDEPVNDDDTVFEAVARHVPFSDRRGDDLVPTPPQPVKPVPRASTPLPVRAASKPPRKIGRLILILLVVSFLIGSALALLLSGNHA